MRNIIVMILCVYFAKIDAQIIGIDFTGQSNCGEKTTTLTDTAEKYGAEYEYVKILNPFSDSSKWLDEYHRFSNYKAGVTSSINDPVYDPTRYGSEISLFWWYNNNNPGKYIYAYKNCYGSAGIELWVNDVDWRNYYYSGLAQKYSQLKEMGKIEDYDLRYFVHIHGETDSNDSARAYNYKSRMLQFHYNNKSRIAELSNYLNIDVDTNYILMLTDLVSIHDYDTVIQRVNQELADEYDWIKKIPAEQSWLGVDQLHYSVDGYIRLGIRINDTIQTLE